MTTFVPSLSLELLRADIPEGVRIRNTTRDDLPQIPDLMRRVYPPPLHGPEAVWSEGNLRSHLGIYPSGQLVAEDKKGRIIGTATSMRVGLDTALAPHTWSAITGHGTLGTHQRDGEVLYGVNIAVDPAYQGQGIGHGLYRKRLELGHREGCLAFIAGARLAGYFRHAYLDPEDYLEAVREGRIFDPTISKQMSLGFMVVGLLRNYAPDPETQGHAALIILLL